MPAAPVVKTIDAPASLLAIEDLGLYDSGRWVWRHRRFAIEAGEQVALTGPSGSGKTALLLTIAGLIPATEGTVRLAGRDIADWPMPDYRRRAHYLPQRPALEDADSVEAIIAAPFRYRANRNLSYRRERLVHWLETLGRGGDFLRRHPDSLSGGEQQITALLRALAIEPEILLLDEPTAAMDGELAARAQQLLRQWQWEHPERAWLWVSHSDSQVEAVAQRRLTLP